MRRLKFILVIFIVNIIVFSIFSLTALAPCAVYAEDIELVDENTGIIVTGNFSLDAELNAAKIESGAKYRLAERALNEISDNFLLYGVGIATPLTGLETFTIYLPIPSNVDPEKCEIYRITNTTATKLVASRSTTHVSFTGKDFGTFAVVIKDSKVSTKSKALSPGEIALIVIGSLTAFAIAVVIIVDKKKKSA